MVDMFLYSPLEVPVGGLLENPFLKDIKKCDVYEISNLCMEYMCDVIFEKYLNGGL